MKKFIVITSCLLFALNFTGCNWEIPEKISVKTNAEYNFALGNLEQDLNENLNLTEILGENDASNEIVAKYDYFPGKANKNVQHFLAEVKICDIEILSASNVNAIFGTETVLPVSTLLSNLSIDSSTSFNESLGLDFSPTDILLSLSDVMKTDIVGKINFSGIPMYLYFEAFPGLSANAKIDLFYGSKTATISERANSRETVYDDMVNNCARPDYSKEDDTILTDLDKKSFSAKTDITDIVNAATENATIEEDDQLCIEYTISSICPEENAATISKSIAQNGIKLAVYALIDIPLSFDCLDNIAMNLNEFAGSLSGENSDENTEESSEENAGNSNSSESANSSDNEFSKYLDVVELISIRYAAYKLPVMVNRKNAMMLGVDMLGKGNYEYAVIYTVKENKVLSDSDKCEIVLKPDTIQQIKNLGTFVPNFLLKIEKDAIFTIPRDKGIKVNIELSLKTDGTIQIN